MDYVEEAWRIVDPVLKMKTPVREYEPGTWGPVDPAQDIVPPGGWANPTRGTDVIGSWLMLAEGLERNPLSSNDWSPRSEWNAPWRRWGPYLSERQWGTVREDYSQDGDAWQYLHPRPRAVARVPLGRGRARRLLRSEAATVFRAGALEREGPDPEGAAVRVEQCRGEPRRGREGVLLLPRFDADPLVHEVAVQVPPGRLPVRRPGGDERASHPAGLRVRAHRHRRVRR